MRFENFDSAITELKRADHSIFATLKYTRSCEVVMNVLDRFTKTYSFAVLAALNHSVEKGNIEEFPADLKGQEELFRQLFPEMTEQMDTYKKVRKIVQIQDYRSEEEFRKNLTLITEINGQEVRIKVEDIEHIYFELKKFMTFIKNVLLEQEEP